MDVRVGLWRRLSAEELMLLNCGVGEDSWESLGLQGDPTSPFWRISAWDFFGRNDAKAETPVLWPPHAKSWLIGKDSAARRDWVQEKGMTEDEMAGWHQWLYGRESEWTPGDGDGQEGLACCGSWGYKELDTTERLNWTELMVRTQFYLLWVLNPSTSLPVPVRYCHSSFRPSGVLCPNYFSDILSCLSSLGLVFSPIYSPHWSVSTFFALQQYYWKHLEYAHWHMHTY